MGLWGALMVRLEWSAAVGGAIKVCYDYWVAVSLGCEISQSLMFQSGHWGWMVLGIPLQWLGHGAGGVTAGTTAMSR